MQIIFWNHILYRCRGFSAKSMSFFTKNETLFRRNWGSELKAVDKMEDHWPLL